MRPFRRFFYLLLSRKGYRDLVPDPLRIGGFRCCREDDEVVDPVALGGHQLVRPVERLRFVRGSKNSCAVAFLAEDLSFPAIHEVRALLRRKLEGEVVYTIPSNLRNRKALTPVELEREAQARLAAETARETLHVMKVVLPPLHADADDEKKGDNSPAPAHLARRLVPPAILLRLVGFGLVDHSSLRGL